MQALDQLLKQLIQAGLRGIEAYYPEHSKEQTRSYIRLAEYHDLLITGGTDFHGTIKPDIALGGDPRDFLVPYQLYDKLNQALAGLT